MNNVLFIIEGHEWLSILLIFIIIKILKKLVNNFYNKKIYKFQEITGSNFHPTDIIMTPFTINNQSIKNWMLKTENSRFNKLQFITVFGGVLYSFIAFAIFTINELLLIPYIFLYKIALVLFIIEAVVSFFMISPIHIEIKKEMDSKFFL